MSFIRAAVLYTALGLCANLGVGAAWADPALIALRDGDMKKLIFHSEPKPVSQVAIEDGDGGTLTLADLGGKYILLNFWATWCAPCRKEMPTLNALQHEFGGDNFRVVTVATGRNQPAAVRRFFEEAGVDVLPMYRDPKQQLAREMAVFGLPISVILNPEGLEIARLRGDADWYSDSARAIFAAMLTLQATN